MHKEAKDVSRNDMVKETMVRSQQVSKKCKQRYTIVTYDLAVAKIAKKIQSDESPLFDDMVIMFGSFHIELSFSHPLERSLKDRVVHMSFQNLDVLLKVR